MKVKKFPSAHFDLQHLHKYQSKWGKNSANMTIQQYKYMKKMEYKINSSAKQINLRTSLSVETVGKGKYQILLKIKEIVSTRLSHMAWYSYKMREI